MNKLLSFGIVGILIIAPVAVYTAHDQKKQLEVFHEQCEMLSLQYELRKAREMLQIETRKVNEISSPQELMRMKEEMKNLECQIQGVNDMLEENAKNMSKIDKEAYDRFQEQAGHLSETVTANLKKVEGKWTQEIDRITGIATNLSATTDDQKNVLSQVQSALNRNPEEMVDSMVLPTIQLNGIDTVGSGILIASVPDPQKTGSYLNYALTSYHVVRNILSESDSGQKPQIRVNTYDGKGAKEEFADIVSYEEDTDMALLKLRTDRHYPNTAKMFPKEQVADVKVFTPIYAVGCPLGNDPIPTVGEIASTKNMINGQNYWMLNAPTYFGNSGGGVYLARTHELIGIFSKIYTHGHGKPVVISHMGLATPIDVVHDWLTKIGYEHLVSRSKTVPTPAAAPK